MAELEQVWQLSTQLPQLVPLVYVPDGHLE